MSATAKNSVPKIILVVIVVLLTAMFVYAQYYDSSPPEETVEQYYAAYFAQDYKSASQKLSVFMANQYLSQYADMSAQELLKNRKQIELDMAELIASIEATTPAANDFEVEVLSQHTRTGEHSALVINHIRHNGQIIGMEVVILIKEEGHYKIFEFSPIQEEMLEEVLSFDLDIIDNSFSQLLDGTA